MINLLSPKTFKCVIPFMQASPIIKIKEISSATLLVLLPMKVPLEMMLLDLLQGLITQPMPESPGFPLELPSKKPQYLKPDLMLTPFEYENQALRKIIFCSNSRLNHIDLSYFQFQAISSPYSSQFYSSSFVTQFYLLVSSLRLFYRLSMILAPFAVSPSFFIFLQNVYASSSSLKDLIVQEGISSTFFIAQANLLQSLGSAIALVQNTTKNLCFIYNMKKGNQYSYQSKAQNKFQGRMNKFKQKSAQKHQDQITRLNAERRKRVELEQAGIVGGQRNKSRDNVKYILIVAICFAVIVYFSFRILQTKIDEDKSQQI